MKRIIKRITNVDVSSFDDIERDVVEIQCLLKERMIEYDGILISIPTGKKYGIAYVFRNQ